MASSPPFLPSGSILQTQSLQQGHELHKIHPRQTSSLKQGPCSAFRSCLIRKLRQNRTNPLNPAQKRRENLPELPNSSLGVSRQVLFFFFLNLRLRHNLLLNVTGNYIVVAKFHRVASLATSHTGESSRIGRYRTQRDFTMDCLQITTG